MILQIKDLINQVPIYIEFEWVKGHQDDQIPFHQLLYQAQLNVIADGKAIDFLKKNILTFRPDPALAFPGKKWSVSQYGEKFSSVDPQILYEWVTSDELKTFWGKKGDIDPSLLSEIDWANFGKFFNTCKFAQQ